MGEYVCNNAYGCEYVYIFMYVRVTISILVGVHIGVKVKESKKNDVNTWTLFESLKKKRGTMKMAVIPIIVRALRSTPKNMEKKQGKVEIREVIEIVQTS